MARKMKVRQPRTNTRRAQYEDEMPEPDIRFARRPDTTPLTGKTENQKRYINAIKNFTLTFATGPAGTGKTFVAGSIAAEFLRDGEVDRIIITRPAVEVGASMGFLPGELEEKYAPFIEPFQSVLEKRLGKSQVEMFLKNGKIEARPLSYMRGATFENAVIILDEAQNTTPAEMKMFLTRIGENCTVIVNGDIEQCDLNGKSGLEDAISKVAWIPEVKVIEFTDADIVRSGIVSDIISSYRRK